jgi:hypothetical protein
MAVHGDKHHIARIRKMRGAIVAPVTEALFDEAKDLAVDAALLITAGATSGANHVPSAPGEPPNADTHVLSGRIEAASTGPLKAETSANAPYAAAQEFGYEPGNLPERTYMRPASAARRATGTAAKRCAAAVNKVIRSVRPGNGT